MRPSGPDIPMSPLRRRPEFRVAAVVLALLVAAGAWGAAQQAPVEIALEAIATCRAGPVNVDVKAATARGIPVLTTPARNADSVADFALGLMLSLCRKIHRAERHLRQKGWMVHGDKLPYFHFRGPELSGKTLGLIGCGAIGRALARRVRAFDMRVLVSDPYIDQASLGALGRLVSLESVLTQADFLSLHVPVTAETKGLLNADQLAMMKPTSPTPSCSRGLGLGAKMPMSSISCRPS